MADGAKDAGNEGLSGVKLGAKYPIMNGSMLDDANLHSYGRFFLMLNESILKTDARHYHSHLALEQGLSMLNALCQRAKDPCKNKIILIGNGGSSAIASHIATDYTKNGGIRTIAFNDAPTLTCLGNDFGIDYIFAKQLEYYALPGDLVIIVSSSGKSGNILRASEQVFAIGLDLVTFSGMNPNNVLRGKGILNFFVPSHDYGLVELTHLALLHSIVSVKENG
jgi:D-sedoheptulose 7-phosphate isomerase